MESILNILRENKLKATPLRKAVLSTLRKEGKGLSHHDLDKMLAVSFDRSTLFRTLNKFEEKGILHKVINDEGVAKYAFTRQAQEENAGDHAHFYCVKCKNIFCLDYSVTLASIPVPDGFQKQGVELQVRGVCLQCILKEKNN